MDRCVKCGTMVLPGAEQCSGCTWPLADSGWPKTERRVSSITLDTSCINAHGNPHLNQLEGWSKEGHFVLQRTDAMLAETTREPWISKARTFAEQSDVFVLDSSLLGGPEVLAGPNWRAEMRELLFPTANTTNTNQNFDVEHLHLHVFHGGDLFVTLNRRDFITRGRQSALKRVGIWVLEPDAAVELLASLYGW